MALSVALPTCPRPRAGPRLVDPTPVGPHAELGAARPRGRGAQHRRPGDGAVGVVGRVARLEGQPVVVLRAPAALDHVRRDRVPRRVALRPPALAALRAAVARRRVRVADRRADPGHRHLRRRCPPVARLGPVPPPAVGDRQVRAARVLRGRPRPPPARGRRLAAGHAPHRERARRRRRADDARARPRVVHGHRGDGRGDARGRRRSGRVISRPSPPPAWRWWRCSPSSSRGGGPACSRSSAAARTRTPPATR